MIILLIGLHAIECRAQHWTPLADGIVGGTGGVNEIYGDTVWDRLLAGCASSWLMHGEDTLFIAGVAQWNGNRWDTLASRIQSIDEEVFNLCSPLWGFVRYSGDLYANGSFSFRTSDGRVNENIARWSTTNNRWEALECNVPYSNGLSTIRMEPPQEELYLTGYKDSLCDYPESCVFAYDGDGFSVFQPFDAWPGTEDDYVGIVFTYREHIYMTGLLNHAETENYYGMLRFDGTAWDTVPGFSTPAPIKDVLIHDDKLYLCGYFFEATGAPGNLVAMFDGERWDDLGGGLRWAPGSDLGNAYDLHEWNGDIYVGGQFNYAGGVYAENVARWNGQQWCGLGGHYANQVPGGRVGSITTWRDSLYISGGFVTIDGDTMNHVAKWSGLVENCSPPVGLQEPNASSAQLIPKLVDGSGRWELSAEEPLAAWWVVDAQGRMVLEGGPASGSVLVDLAGRSPGIHAFMCWSLSGVSSAARLFKP